MSRFPTPALNLSLEAQRNDRPVPLLSSCFLKHRSMSLWDAGTDWVMSFGLENRIPVGTTLLQPCSPVWDPLGRLKVRSVSTLSQGPGAMILVARPLSLQQGAPSDGRLYGLQLSRWRPPGSSRKAPELLAGAPSSGSTSPRRSVLICEVGWPGDTAGQAILVWNARLRPEA